jgi:hypothetical protein
VPHPLQTNTLCGRKTFLTPTKNVIMFLVSLLFFSPWPKTKESKDKSQAAGSSKHMHTTLDASLRIRNKLHFEIVSCYLSALFVVVVVVVAALWKPFLIKQSQCCCCCCLLLKVWPFSFRFMEISLSSRCRPFELNCSFIQQQQRVTTSAHTRHVTSLSLSSSTNTHKKM